MKWMRGLSLVLCFGWMLLGCQKAQVGDTANHSVPSHDGWISSGGDLLLDSQNPWWVNNTKEVTFCIAIDKDTVSVGEEEVEEVFRMALTYWKTEFDGFHAEFVKMKEPKKTQARVVTQTFIKKSCDEKVDLKLLFGIGTLNQAEKDFLREPGKIVARAVRTFYDREQLAGKGFIYFASETGEFALDKAMLPNNVRRKPSLRGELWAPRGVLSSSMLHEVGHIFGVPHLPHGLMSEDYLNSLAVSVSHDLPPALGHEPMPYKPGCYRTTPSFLSPIFRPLHQTQWVAYDSAQSLKKVMGIELPRYALRYLPEKDLPAALVVQNDLDGKHIATFKQFEPQRIFGSIAKVYLTDSQKVFPSIGNLGRNNLVVGGYIRYEGNATIEIEKVEKKVRIELDPLKVQQFKMYGVVNDGPELLLESSVFMNPYLGGKE